MRFNRILPLLFFFLAFGREAHAQYALTVVVENIDELKGKLQIALYNEAEDFLKTGPEYRVVRVDVDSVVMVHRFEELPAGEYAVSLYHDVDGNNKIAKNFIGYPKEPFGFSRDVKIFLSAPKWDEAVFRLQSDTTVVIHLKD